MKDKIYYSTKDEADNNRKIGDRVYYDTRLKLFYIRRRKTRGIF